MSFGLKTALAVGFIALTATTGAEARGGPSFSCYGNLTRADRLVCDDPELSRMAREVARLYRGAGGAQQSRSDVRTYVRGALVSRNRCRSTDCIHDVLQDEIAFLREHQDGSGY